MRGCKCSPEITVKHLDGVPQVNIRHDDWCPVIAQAVNQ